MYIQDNYDRWKQHDTAMEAEFQKLPECDYCGEYVTGEYLFMINGEVICERCLNEHFKKEVSKYVG